MTLTNLQAGVTHSRHIFFALAIFDVTTLRRIMHNPVGSSAKHLAGIAQIRLVLADVLGGTQISSRPSRQDKNIHQINLIPDGGWK